MLFRQEFEFRLLKNVRAKQAKVSERSELHCEFRRRIGDTHINAFGDTHINAFGDTHINAFGDTHVNAFGAWHTYKRGPWGFCSANVNSQQWRSLWSPRWKRSSCDLSWENGCRLLPIRWRFLSIRVVVSTDDESMCMETKPDQWTSESPLHV